MQVQRIRVEFIWAIPIIVVGTPGRGQNTGWGEKTQENRQGSESGGKKRTLRNQEVEN